MLDFAGGIVVHATAGMAALASVFFVGRRRVVDAGMHSIPLVALGTGLLWFGWYGFNAGSELKVDAVTGQAFLNTDIAASFAGPVWMLMAWRFEKNVKFTGLLTGAVAGLATITPCAGLRHRDLGGDHRHGLGRRVLPRGEPQEPAQVGRRARRVGRPRRRRRARDHRARRVRDRGGQRARRRRPARGQRRRSSASRPSPCWARRSWAFAFTYGMLFVINKITPVKVSEAEEAAGLDTALHSEQAYDLDAKD